MVAVAVGAVVGVGVVVVVGVGVGVAVVVGVGVAVVVVMTDRDLAAYHARKLCDEWRRWAAKRNELVIGAYAAGLTKTEISTRMGLARTTIDRIIADAELHERIRGELHAAADGIDPADALPAIQQRLGKGHTP